MANNNPNPEPAPIPEVAPEPQPQHQTEPLFPQPLDTMDQPNQAEGELEDDDNETVVLPPSSPIPDEDEQTEWNMITRLLISNNSSPLENIVYTSKYKTKLVHCLKKYPYSIQYKIVTYILRPDYPPIYSKDSRWIHDGKRQHSYWVTCEILNLISSNRNNTLNREQIEYGLSIIRNGEMNDDDFKMIWEHFIRSLSKLRNTCYYWCKTLIAFLLGINHDTWEGPLKNHIRSKITAYHDLTILKTIHSNYNFTITDDKIFSIFYKWLTSLENIHEHLPRTFAFEV